MADAPAKTGSKGSGKAALYVVGSIVALGVGYYLYEKYAANAAAGTTTSGTAPANTNPAPTSAAPLPATPTPPTSLAAWKQDIINAEVAAGIPGGENIAAIAVADALAGHALGPNEYKYLNQALATVGQPPGGTTIVLAQARKANHTPRVTTSHTPSETPTHSTVTVHSGTGATTHTPTATTRPAPHVVIASQVAKAIRSRANPLKATPESGKVR